MWLLDTNAWIQLIKNPGGPIERAVQKKTPTEICLCSVVLAELRYGANKYERRDLRLAVLDRLLQPFQSFAFDDQAAEHYADIRHNLEKLGMVIGANDLLIAAICRSNQLTLVTSNVKEFERVPGLMLENWSVA